jgi:hypothetical protein
VPSPELVLSLLIELNGAAPGGRRRPAGTLLDRPRAGCAASALGRSLDCPNPPTSPYLDREAPKEYGGQRSRTPPLTSSDAPVM